VVNATGHLLTAGELAQRRQVPKGHVYRLTRDGLIPAVRLGRYYRYRLEAIERWEADSEQIADDRARAA
jgi:excisionase family DNA binding protein